MKQIALASAIYGVLGFATWTMSFGSHPVAASGNCCITSADCAGTYLCYVPSGGLTDCSTDKKNYCRPE
jgi:hypothetical protein